MDEETTVDLEELTLSLPTPPAVDVERRTITGLIVPFGVVADRTNAGPVKFAAGSLLVPSDLSRIKLLIDHDPKQSVGYCIALDQTPAGAVATFKVAPGPAGDDALAQAGPDQRTRDGLSVGIDPRRRHRPADGQHIEVTAAALNEVSLCSMPAYSEARVTRVIASTHRKETTKMDEETNIETSAPAPVTAAAQPAGDMITPAVQPAPFTAAQPASQPASSLEVFEQVASMLQTGMTGAQITAALADVTTAADPAHSLLPAGIIEKAWQAHEAERPYINNAVTNTKPLGTGFKLMAWGWKTRPTVGDYEGNKTEIPSTGVEDVLFEGPVYRVAGGNDVDRIFVDMGDGQMIDELFEGYLADYMLKSDAKVRAALLAAARNLNSGAEFVAPASLPAALVTLGLAMPKGSRIDYVAVAEDVWSDVAGLTRDQVPWWLSSADGLDIGTSEGTIGRTKFWVDPELASGEVLGGDKRAHTYREKKPPVKVQAVDVAKGGVDLAVFGYAAQFTSEPRAIIKMKLN